jgi:NDP-sugar pyrophosphorylase family protein
MKERITITLDKNLISQIDKRIDGIEIKNRSQEIETLLSLALGTNIPSKAVLLLGGESSRLKPLTDKLPKALLKIQGKAVTEHLFDLLKKYGIRDAVLCVGHQKEMLKDHFGDGSKFGMNISYVEEEKNLGTAGCLKLAKKLLTSSFIVMNGDELKNINIPRMFRLHKRKSALATIALTTVGDPAHYGVATLDGSRILEFTEKPSRPATSLINAGFYILEPEVIEMIPNGFSMLEKDIFPRIAGLGRVRGFPFAGQWFDIGSIQRYKMAEKEWEGFWTYGDEE